MTLRFSHAVSAAAFVAVSAGPMLHGASAIEGDLFSPSPIALVAPDDASVAALPSPGPKAGAIAGISLRRTSDIDYGLLQDINNNLSSLHIDTDTVGIGPALTYGAVTPGGYFVSFSAAGRFGENTTDFNVTPQNSLLFTIDGQSAFNFGNNPLQGSADYDDREIDFTADVWRPLRGVSFGAVHDPGDAGLEGMAERFRSSLNFGVRGGYREQSLDLNLQSQPNNVMQLSGKLDTFEFGAHVGASHVLRINDRTALEGLVKLGIIVDSSDLDGVQTFGNNTFRQSDSEAHVALEVAPRISLAYDMMGDGKSKFWVSAHGAYVSGAPTMRLPTQQNETLRIGHDALYELGVGLGVTIELGQ